MTHAGERWYRPPVVWLGAAILLTSLGGCIAIFIMATSGG
jgi:hypothetical protein